MKKLMELLKKTTITETIRLNRICWFGHVQRMEENRIPRRGTTRLRGRPRNIWQDEVREDGMNEYQPPHLNSKKAMK
jgi:hypothetical protein